MNQQSTTYYDKNGVEIQEGDLLKIFHFIHYRRRRKVYMYHVAMKVDGYWMGRLYNENKPHYNLRAVADNQTHIIKNCEIISKPDYENEEQLRDEGRLRLKKIKEEELLNQ